MTRQDGAELWNNITTSERLTPDDVKKICYLSRDFELHKIERTQLITSFLLILEKDQTLRQRFIEICCTNYNLQQDGDEETIENRKEDGGDAGLARKGYLMKTSSKKGFLVKDKIQTPMKKSRPLKREIKMTPSYKRIVKEEDSSSTESDEELRVLNNKCASVGKMKRYGGRKHKKLNEYEEAMAKCEDDMFEIDRWIGTFSSALEKAEKVMSGEIGFEKIGDMFYICIKHMYGQESQDMAEIVRQDYGKALPVIIRRLRQKLDEATLVKESSKPVWKQVFEENTTKQRDVTAKGPRWRTCRGKPTNYSELDFLPRDM